MDNIVVESIARAKLLDLFDSISVTPPEQLKFEGAGILYLGSCTGPVDQVEGWFCGNLLSPTNVVSEAMNGVKPDRGDIAETRSLGECLVRDRFVETGKQQGFAKADFRRGRGFPARRALF